jgi:hypothetical protein
MIDCTTCKGCIHVWKDAPGGGPMCGNPESYHFWFLTYDNGCTLKEVAESQPPQHNED